MAAHDRVEVVGIARQSQFPECLPNHPATQICQADKLWLGNIKCLKKVVQVCVGIQITDSRVICTPMGRKLVVEGIRQIKVIYLEDYCGEKKSTCFLIPFVLFVLLRDTTEKIVKVCALIEDISVKQFPGKNIVVTTVIFACPIFGRKVTGGMECCCDGDEIGEGATYQEVCYYEHAMEGNFVNSGFHFPHNGEPCYSVSGKNYYYGR